MTAGAEEAITLAGLLTSFGQAARTTLVKLTGIRVSESTVQRVTEDAGEKLGQRLAAKETFGPTQSWPWNQDKTGQTCARWTIRATGPTVGRLVPDLSNPAANGSSLSD